MLPSSGYNIGQTPHLNQPDYTAFPDNVFYLLSFVDISLHRHVVPPAQSHEGADIY
jgi:hypothetical protein